MFERSKRDHAVVIGASMGGLLAARALAEAFARVTVIERDALPAAPAARKGVPQGNHAHGLLARGREILEDFFPGITEELVARGAHRGEVAGDVLWHCGGGFLAGAQSGLVGLTLSRPLLEGQVRERVRALPNIRFLDEADVLGLTTSTDRARVTGVDVRRGGAEEEIAADLVVDASGRASRSPAWLAALGYDAPVQEEMRVGLTYTSRFYRRRAGDLGGKMGIVIAAQPPNTRVSAVLAVERDRWLVSAAGYLGEEVPANDAGFVDFLVGLPCRAVHDLVRGAEPVSEFKTFKFAASTRRRYERMRRFPAGYLVFGDAISRFNPVFGQGMTVAALQGVALRDCLGAGGELWRRFFKRAARAIDVPWDIAAGADLAFPTVEGRRGPMVRFLNRYIARVYRAAHRDPAVGTAFLRVANLMAPPATLMVPGMLWRVLRARGPAHQPVPAMGPAE